ncbi:MAG: hypothetical protein GWO19_04345, partial [Nitrospinaceae bacterium]|nr:hypothetical protein [Nitrospinaceae bacterium]NIS84326.1 hypothetical protein [Nitrospinaceae bacterium]NIU95534.1 hypothetical protein [Nitrospinaceae bacterium]
MNTQLRNTVLSVSFSGKDGLHVDAKHKNHLAELIRGYPLGNVLGTLDRKITSIAFDSRKVTPGGLFVAIHGFKRDGSRFIEDAIQRGAVAFITEERIENLSPLGLGVKDVTAITVRDARDALAWLSASFYRHPCERLQVVGITGTNGKTTLTYILETLFRERGLSSGVIGTVNYRYGGHDYPA